MRKAISREVVIVERMMRIEFPPTSRTVMKFMPKPKNTILPCRTFFDVNLTPRSKSFGRRKKATIIPKRMAKTALPMTGTSLPKNHAGTASTRQSAIPGITSFNHCTTWGKTGFFG